MTIYILKRNKEERYVFDNIEEAMAKAHSEKCSVCRKIYKNGELQDVRKISVKKYESILNRLKWESKGERQDYRLAWCSKQGKDVFIERSMGTASLEAMASLLVEFEPTNELVVSPFDGSYVDVFHVMQAQVNVGKAWRLMYETPVEPTLKRF